MFEFGLAAMNGFCSGFVGFVIGFAVAADSRKSGRVDVPTLTIGAADAVAAAPPSSVATAITRAAQSGARVNFTDLELWNLFLRGADSGQPRPLFTFCQVDTA